MVTAESILSMVRAVQAALPRPQLSEIVVSHSIVSREEDWSGVRSPSRAKRRRAKHPQRIVVKDVPAVLVIGRTMYMHPVKWREMLARSDLRTEPGYSLHGDSLMGIPVRFR